MPTIDELIKRCHCEREIIFLSCVRRYRRFRLSVRYLVEMMARRGIYLARTTTGPGKGAR